MHPDLSVVARKLGTQVLWVEHCMRSYGRNPRRPGRENAEGREEFFERLEEEELEEKASEDLEAGEDVPRELRDKPRVLRPKKTPTPGGFRE